MKSSSHLFRLNRRARVAGLALGATLALVACGGADESDPIGLSAGGSDTGTAGSGATSTGTGGGGAGDVGAGGSGGEGPSVNVSQLQVGEPAFDVVDFQLFSAPLGTTLDDFAERKPTTEKVAADHEFLMDLNLLVPRQPAAPPYDTELTSGVLAAGFLSKDHYAVQEWEAPQGIYLAALIVPNGAAVDGSSTDFESGPIVPNSIFPLTIDVDLWKGGAMFDADFDYEYPTTDELLPETQVDGYSHIPIFFWRNTDMISGAPDTYQFRMRIVDAQGNGWRVFVPLFVQ